MFNLNKSLKKKNWSKCKKSLNIYLTKGHELDFKIVIPFARHLENIYCFLPLIKNADGLSCVIIF